MMRIGLTMVAAGLGLAACASPHHPVHRGPVTYHRPPAIAAQPAAQASVATPAATPAAKLPATERQPGETVPLSGFRPMRGQSPGSGI